MRRHLQQDWGVLCKAQAVFQQHPSLSQAPAARVRQSESTAQLFYSGPLTGSETCPHRAGAQPRTDVAHSGIRRANRPNLPRLE